MNEVTVADVKKELEDVETLEDYEEMLEQYAPDEIQLNGAATPEEFMQETERLLSYLEQQRDEDVKQVRDAIYSSLSDIAEIEVFLEEGLPDRTDYFERDALIHSRQARNKRYEATSGSMSPQETSYEPTGREAQEAYRTVHTPEIDHL